MLPELLPETFRNLPELRVFEDLLTAGLTEPSYRRLTDTNLQLTGHTYGAHLRGPVRKVVNLRAGFEYTSITNHSMKKLPELLPVIFRNLPELRGN